MLSDSSKDILSSELDFMSIALIAGKIKVLVIGGGNAGFIKSRSFTKKGCRVTVVSEDFCDAFETLSRCENLQCIDGMYQVDYIIPNHLIVIAIDDETLRQIIIKDCEIHHKLYLNCKNFKDGTFTIPAQGKTENIGFSVHTKRANPKTAMFLVNIMEKRLADYDALVEYNQRIREKIKFSPYKNKILNFISSEDFNFFVHKKAGNLVLGMFYGGFNFEIKNCDEKE